MFNICYTFLKKSATRNEKMLNRKKTHTHTFPSLISPWPFVTKSSFCNEPTTNEKNDDSQQHKHTHNQKLHGTNGREIHGEMRQRQQSFHI